MRIVFMGTPDFALPSLKALVEGGWQVVGVFCQPDRPAGRGKKVKACPVKQYAVDQGIPVFQPERIRRPDGLEMLMALKPDLCVTVAFGQILSQENLNVPRLGTVNVHASLLPKHRGAAPINWAILMGEEYTGITTMFTDTGLDTGDMIMQQKTRILPDETAGELGERLAHMGAELLMETLSAIEGGDCPRIPQDEEMASYEPMLDKKMGRLDFSQDALDLHNRVRSLNPWPGAFAVMGDGVLKIWKTRVLHGEWAGCPGEVILSSPKEGLVIRCGDGALELLEIQAPNAKRMEARAYLLGKSLKTGTVLNG